MEQLRRRTRADSGRAGLFLRLEVVRDEVSLELRGDEVDCFTEAGIGAERSREN